MMKRMLLVSIGLVAATVTPTTSQAVASHIAKVNVGGRRFEFSRDLTKEHPESMLAQLFSDDHQECEFEPEEPNIFLDRNGESFALVLDFLRDGKIVLPSTVSTDTFIRDLDFYGIRYDDKDIVDGDKVVAASKQQNSTLHHKIIALFEENEQKIASIPEQPCVDIDLKAMIDACGPSHRRFPSCFESCVENDEKMDQSAMLSRMEANGNHENVPSCPELTGALCRCNSKCSSGAGETCKRILVNQMNCALANELDCEGHTCSEASVGFGSKGASLA